MRTCNKMLICCFSSLLYVTKKIYNHFAFLNANLFCFAFSWMELWVWTLIMVIWFTISHKMSSVCCRNSAGFFFLSLFMIIVSAKNLERDYMRDYFLESQFEIQIISLFALFFGVLIYSETDETAADTTDMEESARRTHSTHEQTYCMARHRAEVHMEARGCLHRTYPSRPLCTHWRKMYNCGIRWVDWH